MKYAVMTFMYRGHIGRGEITHEGLVQLLADSGAQGIEAFDRDLLAEPDLVPRYQKAMADAGITMPVIDVMVNLVYTSPAERQERVDDLRQLFFPDIRLSKRYKLFHNFTCALDARESRKSFAEQFRSKHLHNIYKFQQRIAVIIKARDTFPAGHGEIRSFTNLREPNIRIIF